MCGNQQEAPVGAGELPGFVVRSGRHLDAPVAVEGQLEPPVLEREQTLGRKVEQRQYWCAFGRAVLRIHAPRIRATCADAERKWLGDTDGERGRAIVKDEGHCVVEPALRNGQAFNGNLERVVGLGDVV